MFSKRQRIPHDGVRLNSPGGKLAPRPENYFPPVSDLFFEEIFAPEKKEGKRPGLSQNHFPGCVLEAIK